MKMMGLLCVLGLGSCAMGQSFPIVPLTEPVYPYTDPAFAWVYEDYLERGSIWCMGDLTGDSLEDFVVVFDLEHKLSTPSHLWAFTRMSSEFFSQPHVLELRHELDGMQPYVTSVSDIRVHDFNNDGLNDIILVDTEGSVLPYTREGDEFVLRETLVSRADCNPAKLLITDTNADGIEDFVVYSTETSRLWIHRQLTNGEQEYLVPDVSVINHSEYAGAEVGFSDADDDGDIDIILTNREQSYIAWNELGSFSPAEPLQVEIENFTDLLRAKTIADVNGDGMKDIVFFGEGNSYEGFGYLLSPFSRDAEIVEIEFFEFERFINLRSRDFLSPQIHSHTLTSPGDLDGDGVDDLIFRPFMNSTDIAWRITDPINRNGRFGISNQHQLLGEAKFDRMLTLPGHQAQRTSDAYTDLNNDGVLDRVMLITARQFVSPHDDDQSNDHNGLTLVGELAYITQPRVILDEQDSIRSSGAIHLTDADLNYDGIPEIIATSFDQAKLIRNYPGQQWDDEFGPRSTLFRNVGFRSVITQLDSSPELDVVSLFQNADAIIPEIFLNINIPPFGVRYQPESLNQSIDYRSMLDTEYRNFSNLGTSFDVSDIDLDGDNDILIRLSGRDSDSNSVQSILLWTNDGDANFTPGIPALTGSYFGFDDTHHITSLDVDKDGDLDVLSVEGDEFSPLLGVYLNDGIGTFDFSTAIPVTSSPTLGLEPYWIEKTDIDGDGLLDIMVLSRKTNPSRSEVAILYNTAQGLSTQPVIIPGRGAVEVHCLDLNQDSIPELVTCDVFGINSISIMFQDSPRVFRPAISIQEGEISGVHSVDMNFDGSPDLIASSSSWGSVQVFYSVPPPCLADLNLDGNLNFYDIALFIEQYIDGRRLVDLNRDGQLDFFDVTEMIGSYTEGCP